MKLKKTVYIILTIILGLILSFWVHAGIEIFYISYLLDKEILPEPSSLTHQCYLPSFLQILLLLIGLFGGYFLGQKWWQIVYVEGKRGQKIKNLWSKLKPEKLVGILLLLKKI